MRRLLTLSLLLIAAGSGCRMCASPYDYCGPVVDDGCCGGEYQNYAPRYHGAPATNDSVIDGSQDQIYYESSRPKTPKTATKAKRFPSAVPAATLPRQAKQPNSVRSY
ncbi:MAG: hypothetical protein IT427_03075 [Pirellulales bacterium]|nr:hypothetical protein [Pirellulales bacterium]